MNCMYNRSVIRYRVKRTQALVETTLPGIARSTEVLRRSDGCPVSRYHGSTSGAMPPKTHGDDRFFASSITISICSNGMRRHTCVAPLSPINSR